MSAEVATAKKRDRAPRWPLDNCLRRERSKRLTHRCLPLIAWSLLLRFALPCFSQPIPVQFIGAEKNFGIKQIKADNVPLLVDDAAGFYLIGSATGTDDRNNIASFVKNTDGLMHSMNGDTKVSLPYSFTVEPDAKDKTKLAFKISLGPATMPIATVSMPVDGHRKLFTAYRYEGAKTIERYDENPDHYTPPDRGQYNIRFAPGLPKWGEMIGPDYTVRITLAASSHPMSLAFVDAPSLSTGVRNVEFGFGALKVGEQASATGQIQVLKTDRTLLQLAPKRAPVSNEANEPFHRDGNR